MREHHAATSATLVVHPPAPAGPRHRRPTPSGRRPALVLGLALAAAAALAACGSAPASPAPAPSASAFPMTITEAGGGTVVLHKRPARIVSLSPTATEMLFAIGAGRQVVAVDEDSNYPANAPMTKLSGFTPNIEAIAGYTPDLVVASDDVGGLVHGLQALNVPVLLEPAATTLDQAYAQLQQLGDATGDRPAADRVVKGMRTDIASIVASVKKPSRQLSVYHELDNTYYSATSKTFIGQAYTLLGLKDIADGASSTVPDYPQLSAEYIVSANPDLIVLADTRCCHQDASAVAARPGWSGIAAVKHNEVIPADDDIASRWGPRFVDFLRLIAQHVDELEKQPAAA